MSEPFVPVTKVTSVADYVDRVLTDTEPWGKSLIEGCSPWFRGQCDIGQAPLPGIYREENQHVPEQEISGKFRKLAPMFGKTPARSAYDEWLFLMQHVGVPTRLLDWSEGALIGLYFAVNQVCSDKNPCVWVLHPLELNRAALDLEGPPSLRMFPEPGEPAFHNRCVFALLKHGSDRSGNQLDTSEEDPDRLLWPIAIIPTYTHPRMKSQRGCFTLHGSSSASIEEVARRLGLLEPPGPFLRKYEIPRACARRMLYDLRMLGITESTLFPDHDGLAVDLKNAFREERKARRGL